MTTFDEATLDPFNSTRLFVERARQVRPNFVVDDRSGRHIVSICSRLDGIPLAIELAAARVRAMPLDRLDTGLNQAFRLLTGGFRDKLARQQTLLASIAWSVDLLDEREQKVLIRLAVFQAPFELEIAEAVAADGDVVEEIEVLDVLQRLVDKSLVQFDDHQNRYRILEPVRQFAFDQLQRSGALAEVRDRHALAFASLCEHAAQGRRGLTFDASHPDVADLFTALILADLRCGRTLRWE